MMSFCNKANKSCRKSQTQLSTQAKQKLLFFFPININDFPLYPKTILNENYRILREESLEPKL